MKLLFLLTGTAFLTWWFLLGLLNPYIEAAFGILITGLFVVVSFFLSPFIRIARKLYHFLQLLFAPVWVKIVGFAFIGAGIFLLDHFYNTTIFAEDQTTFYRIVVANRIFWVTDFAAWTGGFSLGLAALYLIEVMLNFINWLIDRPIQISIVIQK